MHHVCLIPQQTTCCPTLVKIQRRPGKQPLWDLVLRTREISRMFRHHACLSYNCLTESTISLLHFSCARLFSSHLIQRPDVFAVSPSPPPSPPSSPHTSSPNPPPSPPPRPPFSPPPVPPPRLPPSPPQPRPPPCLGVSFILLTSLAN
jgi:hypothetical protein